MTDPARAPTSLPGRGPGASATSLRAPDAATSAELDLAAERRRMLIQIIVGLVALFGAVFAIIRIFHEETIWAGHLFVDHLGGPGVMLGYFVVDAFLVPIPNDTFSILGVLGGMSFVEVTLWGSAGSFAGGMIGYAIGYHILRKSRAAAVLLGTGEASTLERVRRGGVTFMILAALTPLPYAVGCWAAGAIEMPLRTVALISLLRIVKVGGYLWLFQLGFVAL